MCHKKFDGNSTQFFRRKCILIITKNIAVHLLVNDDQAKGGAGFTRNPQLVTFAYQLVKFASDYNSKSKILCYRNEQVRASYMLLEAHRERQEKITALQTQLECKNLAGLLYVLCSERRKCKLEKMRLIEGK